MPATQCCTGFSEVTLNNVSWPTLIQFQAIVGKASNYVF